MPQIVTFLTFDAGKAEEAARYYCSIFEDSRIGRISRFGDSGPGPAGSVQTVEFELAGQPFVALNGGPNFPFGMGLSISVQCETQEEVDHYWERLTEGGEEMPCGWLKDRYGVAWQVNPTLLLELLGDPDPARAKQAFDAMCQMTKIDLAALRRAVGEE